MKAVLYPPSGGSAVVVVVPFDAPLFPVRSPRVPIAPPPSTDGRLLANRPGAATVGPCRLGLLSTRESCPIYLSIYLWPHLYLSI